MTGRRLLTVLLTGVAACSCEDHKSPTGLEVVSMRIGRMEFKLEVAVKEADQMRGLMFRDSMGKWHGMMFIFGEEAARSFWMKDVRFPLDVIFISSSGRVVSIRQMAPYDLRSTASDGPCKYVIELNKGMAEGCGVKVGDVVEIPAKWHR